MFTKNSNAPFPHGDALKAVFDKLYSGLEFAAEEGIYETKHRLEKLGDGYYFVGNDVYRKADIDKYIKAQEIKAAATFIETNYQPTDENTKNIFTYFCRFNAEIQQIIDTHKLQDIISGPLTIARAYQDYGTYLWQQIDRFDKRNFTSQGAYKSM